MERFFPQLLVPTQPLKTVNYTWAIYYNFDQYLWSPEGRPDDGIGLFFRFGASDGVARSNTRTTSASARKASSLAVRTTASGSAGRIPSCPATSCPSCGKH